MMRSDSFASLTLRSIVVRLTALKDKPGSAVEIICNGQAYSYTCQDAKITRKEILTAVLEMIGLAYAENPHCRG